MPALITLILVLFLSLIVVRIAAVALTLTGMPRAAAQFQARSAWTATGFTTAESEQVVSHPVRRRIIALLMVARSVGVVTAATTLALSFVNVQANSEGWLRVGLLSVGLLALWLFARSSWIEKRMSELIAWTLKRYGDLDHRDYGAMLHLAGEYAVVELKVRPDSWLADRSLEQLELPDEGVLALGVSRSDGAYIGAPKGDLRIATGDTVLLYGRAPVLEAIDKRPPDVGGDVLHSAAVREQTGVAKSHIAKSHAANTHVASGIGGSCERPVPWGIRG
jgi:TrkA-C domain